MSSRSLVNPLQRLVKKAANTLPKTTGQVAAQQERINRRAGRVVVLADISASMDTMAWGGQRKIDILRDAVSIALQGRTAKLFVFSGNVREVSAIPTMTEANTALHNALAHVRTLDPGVTLVISDGQPDNAPAALAEAAKFRGVIDVLYVGPETDAAAIAFMRKLAQATNGDVRIHDIAKLGNSQELLTHIAGLLR
jgi:Mg-chelatase subunit ChlD